MFTLDSSPNKMSIPSATPSPVSPVQWPRTFAYTPESVRVCKSNDKLSEHLESHLDDEDMLPTQFHADPDVAWGRGPVHRQRPGGDPYFSSSVSTVPMKRSRSEAPPLSGHNKLDGCDTRHTSRSSSKLRAGKTRSRTQCMSPGRGAPSVHVVPSTRVRSHRMLLDAVEIVSKKRPRDRRFDPRASPIESVRKTACLHCPSPPASCTPKDVSIYGNYPIAMTKDERAGSELTLRRKTSKYFAHASLGQTRLVPEGRRVLTPPSSPLLTIPVHIETSDFEYPSFEDSFDEPEGTVDDSIHAPTRYSNTGLFDDLMTMLRRLKPILVQESVQDDPWKVLIAVRLLNVTTGKAAIPVFCKILSRWPTPQDLVHASHNELIELLRPLGLYNKRARWLKDVSERFSGDHGSRTALTSFLSEERNVTGTSRSHYPGVGPYALDSLRIFCMGDKNAWKHVMPSDKELVRYLRWRWAVEEGKIWYPNGKGVIGDVNVPYLITLVDELVAHYDGAIGGEGYMYHFCNDLCEVLSGKDMEP